MDKLTKDFEKSLFETTKDIIGDYLEIGIDSFIDEGILEDIPIVKTIVGALKLGKNIYYRNLLKQSLTFINEFNSNNISKEKLNNYKEEIENNVKKCEEELGRILFLLNKFIEKEKSIMLAKLFKEYIEQAINWDEFREYSEIINRLFIQDLRILKKIGKENVDLIFSREDNFRVERLYSLGLIEMSLKPLTYGDIKDGHVNSGRTISPLGRKFCKIIFKDELL